MESKRKIRFTTVPKIAMCLCKSIVVCAEEGTKNMPDKNVLISLLSFFLILFMPELMNKACWVVRAVKARNSLLVCSSVMFCSVQPTLLT